MYTYHTEPDRKTNETRPLWRYDISICNNDMACGFIIRTNIHVFRVNLRPEQAHSHPDSQNYQDFRLISAIQHFSFADSL